MQRWLYRCRAKGANWGVTRRPGDVEAGYSMKIILMVTAALFAMPSVAAAADLAIGKYPVGAAARAAPARPGAFGPGERGGGRVAPEGAFGGGVVSGGRAPVAPEQPERPIAEGAGEKNLLPELRTAKNAKPAAVALLSTTYSRQQADNPAARSRWRLSVASALPPPNSRLHRPTRSSNRSRRRRSWPHPAR